MLRPRNPRDNIAPTKIKKRRIPAVFPNAVYSLREIVDHWQLGDDVFKAARQLVIDHHSMTGAPTDNGDLLVRGETAIVAIFRVLRERESGGAV